MEQFAQRPKIAGQPFRAAYRDGNGVLPTDITQIGIEAEIGGILCDAVARDLILARSRKLAKHCFDWSRIERAEPTDQGTDEILPPRCHQHSERGERSGELR